MDRIKQTVADIVDLFMEVSKILMPFAQRQTASYDLFNYSTSLCKIAVDTLTMNQFTRKELSTIISMQKSFGRHLSEVEQSVYEEIGPNQLKRLQATLTPEIVLYNQLYDYLGLGENN